MTAEEIAERLGCGDLQIGQSRKVSAPYRDDDDPSLNVSRTDKTVLFFDHGYDGNAFEALKHFFVSENGHKPMAVKRSQFAIEATYDYVDEDGRLLFQVVRGKDKKFKQRRKVGGQWVNNLDGIPRVLYHLPEVIEAVDQSQTVYIVEGERDVEAMRNAGVVATCNPMGAGKWRDEYSRFLAQADVVIVQDRDDAGIKHARDVGRSLAGVAHRVRVVEALTGKDASDHLAADHSLDEFLPVTELASRASLRVVEPERGGDAILDSPATVVSVWGAGSDSLWASGEPFMLAGVQGVGKTTLAQQIALARIGVKPKFVLGFPVAQTTDPILYIAADRPSQARRSFARMVREEHRQVLNERLLFWKGPPSFDAGKEPDKFAQWVLSFGCSTIFIDSLKDIATDLSKDETGSRVNIALQHLVANGVEVATSHHQRKATAENKKPTTLSDVYGSTWLTSGHGSVVLLWGNPGDLVVELLHLKQPAEVVGPLEVLHDHDAGESRLLTGGSDIRVHFRQGQDVTVKQVAQMLGGKDDPTRNEVEKARRKLKRLVSEGKANVRDGSNPGTAEKIYRILDVSDLDEAES